MISIFDFYVFIISAKEKNELVLRKKCEEMEVELKKTVDLQKKSFSDEEGVTQR